MANRRQINIHLNDEEWARLAERASARGVTPGYLVKRWMLEGLDRKPTQQEAASNDVR